MNTIAQLIREDLRNIKAYPVSPLSSVNIFLDKNELPMQINTNEKNVNRYPTTTTTLQQALADYYQLESSQILPCRGSSDGIDLLIRLFCKPFHDKVIICPPTFAMYAVWAKIQGVAVIEIPLINKEADFAWDFASIKNAAAKLIFICSPNNPTGTMVPLDKLVDLCNALQNKAIVVVDEAYIEFAEEKSIACFIKECPNLVVLRTFSKAFGLAGIRFGCILANATLIEYLQSIMPPFAIAGATLKTALLAMRSDYLAKVKTTALQVRQTRSQFAKELLTVNAVKKVWPSKANFLLIQVQDANNIFDNCLKQGILIKKVIQNPYLKNCLRLTVGTACENKKVVEVLRGYEK